MTVDQGVKCPQIWGYFLLFPNARKRLFLCLLIVANRPGNDAKRGDENACRYSSPLCLNDDVASTPSETSALKESPSVSALRSRRNGICIAAIRLRTSGPKLRVRRSTERNVK